MTIRRKFFYSSVYNISNDLGMCTYLLFFGKNAELNGQDRVKKLRVFASAVPNYGDKNPIGEILIDKEFKISFTALAEGESVMKLKKALTEIGAEKNLRLPWETRDHKLGEKIVTPDDPNYIWAICEALRKKLGFGCMK